MNTGGNQRIALFLYNKKKSIGGMETHAEYFIRYFNEHELLHCIVYRDEINVCSINKNYKYSSTSELFDYLEVNKINVLFFSLYTMTLLLFTGNIEMCLREIR